MKNLAHRNVLVQDCDTKLFLAIDGSWTSDRARVRDFHESLSATVFCLQQKFQRAHVLVQFNMPGTCDVVIPISVPFVSAETLP
jgi:hypothetical protein